MHRKRLCIPAALICLIAQAALARNIFVTSADPTSPFLTTINAEPFSFGAQTGTVAGQFTVLPSADPQKFYLISRASFDTVAVLTGRFPNVSISKRIQVGGEATAADITGDGRRLIVVGPAGVGIVDTSIDNAPILMGNLDVGSSPVDVATSIDSKFAYVLSASSQRLTAIDLTNNTVGVKAQIPSTPNAVTVGPNGIVYVSAQNGIYELDPVTLTTRAVIRINGTADNLLFTPNGRFAIARNTGSFGSRGAFVVDLASRKVSESPLSGVTFAELALVNDNTAYGITTQGGLVVINIAADGSVTQANANVVGGSLPSSIAHLVATGELPRSRSLIIGSGTYLYRIDTSSLELSDRVLVNNNGALTAVNPITTAQSGGVLTFNSTQTAAPGTKSLPLVVQSYDASGYPAYNNAVVFSSATPGVLTNPTATTDIFGRASTIVNVPAGQSAPITVTATVSGVRTATFTINPGDPGLPGAGSGTGTGTPVVTGLQILTGQGEAIGENFSTSFQEPLTVRFNDNNGNPVQGVPIVWSLVSGQGQGNVIALNSGTTDSNGVSTANFTSTALPTGVTYLTNAIRATAPNGQEVIFYVTTVRAQRGTLTSITSRVLQPQGSVIDARVGQVIPNAIQVAVAATVDATPIPFVGLKVTPNTTDITGGATAECRGGTSLSDRSGLISCDLVIGNRAGSFTIDVNVGSVAHYGFQINVALGEPAVVRVLQGSNQSGNPGTTSQPLIVNVTDAGGNLLINTPVSWEIPGNVSVSSIQRVTDGSGQASAVVVFPSTPGAFTVRAVAGSASGSFTLTTNAVAGSVAIAGGDQQSAIVGQAFGQTISVRVLDGQGRNLPGATVNFAVTSGSGTVNPASALTNSDGIATANVTAGASAGPLVITATTGNSQVTFNLATRLAGPAFTAASFLNAASFQPGISPGSLAYIRVGGVAPNVRGSVTPSNPVAPWPTRLNDVEVQFNGVSAPIYAVSNINGEESVIVQVPFETPVSPATVTIRSAGGGSTTVSNVAINAVAPGVFTFPDSGGRTYAVATRPDGSYVTSSNPARRGETLRIYATGLGQTTPATGTNRVGIANQPIAASLIVGVNNAGTRLVSAEALPGTIGVYAITLEIPADTATGPNQGIGLAVTQPSGSALFANSVFVPIN